MRTPNVLLLLLLLTATLLSGCGDPSVIAYTRGQFFEGKARAEANNSKDYLPNNAKDDYKNAIEQYTAAIKLKAHNYNAVYQRALCYKALREDKEAFTDFSEAAALKPKTWEVWQERAEVEDRLGEFEHATEDLTQAITLYPHKDGSALHLYLARASAETDCNRLDDALKDCNYTVEKSPKWAGAYVQRATTRWIRGDRKEADADFAKAEELNPHWNMPYQVRGYYEFAKGDYKAAVKDLERSLELTKERDAEEPFYAVIFCSQAYRLQKDIKDANNLLDECVEEAGLPVATKDGAENAQLADHWPAPAIQFFRRDIGRTQLIASAKGENNKLTEVHCYIALDDIANGRPKDAKPHIDWILKNGNRGFVEYRIATELAKKDLS